jgi:hypothetical protein
VRGDALWPHKLWAVKALAAQEKEVETVRYAEACRSLWARDLDIDGLYGRGSRFLCLRQVRVSVSIEVAAVNTFRTGPSGKDRALALQPTLELDPPRRCGRNTLPGKACSIHAWSHRSNRRDYEHSWSLQLLFSC